MRFSKKINILNLVLAVVFLGILSLFITSFGFRSKETATVSSNEGGILKNRDRIIWTEERLPQNLFRKRKIEQQLLPPTAPESSVATGNPQSAGTQPTASLAQALTRLATSLTRLQPAPPTYVTLATGSSYVALSWNNDRILNEDGYTIERKTSGTSFIPIANLPADSWYAFDTSTAGNTQYSYRIKSFNSAGASYSQVQSITTLSLPPGAPAQPSGLNAAVVSPTAVNLSWQDNSTNELHFYVMRGTSPWSYAAFYVPAHPGTGLVNFIDNGGVGNTRYWYKIYVESSSPVGTYSNLVEIVTPIDPQAPSIPPSAPFFEMAGVGWMPPGIPRPTLVWYNVPNETNYTLERSVNSTSNFVSVGTGSGIPPIGYYLDKNVAGNTDYYYRVKAYNQWGNSPYSSVIQLHVN